MERVQLPSGRQLHFADFYDADSWIADHADDHPTAQTAEWDGISDRCVYDAQTGQLLVRGAHCSRCALRPCPEFDWTETAACIDLAAALARRGLVTSPQLLALAAELAEFSPQLTGEELASVLLHRPLPPRPAAPPRSARLRRVGARHAS